MYIGGEFVEAVDGRWSESICPADQKVIARFPKGNAKDVDRAVASARTAFDETDWGSLRNAQTRGELLRAVAAKIRERIDHLAECESLDSGKIIMETNLIDVNWAADTYDYFADQATNIYGEVLPVPTDCLDFTLREPLGVCSSIVAWNYPIMFVAWKVAPALAAGNTVVLKPAELTSVTALEMAKIFDEVGIPAGVVNVVTGPGSAVGNRLALHPDVDKISFTGSTEIGRQVMAAASVNCKHVTLELGGKSPNIVFDDAELDKAVSGALTGIFMNMGEACIAGSRLFLQEGIYDVFMERFLERVSRIKVGHPLDWEARQGALSSPGQLATVRGYIQKGLDEGAKLLAGGLDKPEVEGYPDGNWCYPTVFACDHDDYTIAREEIFGPVLTVFKFKGADEVVRRANDTIYGLAAAVWTSNVRTAINAARRLRAGQVWVNQYAIISAYSPHGGYKQSGFGKDLSKYALENYTQIKNVYIDTSEDEEIICLFE
jgi:acyl-CoA reductase-like NAD-dependent aldehyde dehydrogenase